MVFIKKKKKKFFLIKLSLGYVAFYKVKKLNSNMLNNLAHVIQTGKLSFQPGPAVSSERN